MTRKLALILLLATVAVMGCAKVTKTYRWVLGGINPNPEITLEPSTFSEESEERLAMLFTPVDRQIQSLQREVDSQTSYPERDWFGMVFSRYPWVGGVMIVESTGEIIDRQPEFNLKPLDFSPLLEVGEAWNDGRMRAHVQATDLGAEVFLANSYTRDRSWIGLTIVHFDFRSLMRFCPAPEELVVFSPAAVLSAQGQEEYAERLLDAPWERILKSSVQGQIELAEQNVTFTWLARVLGGEYIIYAVREQ